MVSMRCIEDLVGHPAGSRRSDDALRRDAHPL
jgi:hypothetical protein